MCDVRTSISNKIIIRIGKDYGFCVKRMVNCILGFCRFSMLCGRTEEKKAESIQSIGENCARRQGTRTTWHYKKQGTCGGGKMPDCLERICRVDSVDVILPSLPRPTLHTRTEWGLSGRQFQTLCRILLSQTRHFSFHPSTVHTLFHASFKTTE